MKKKILFVPENISWGGSELLWAKSILEIVNMNYEVGLIIHEKLILPVWLLEFDNKSNFKIFRYSDLKLNKFQRILKKISPFIFRKKTTKLVMIDEFKPDLLIINQGLNFNGVATMLFAISKKIKFVTISHAVCEYLWPNSELREKMKLGFIHSKMNFFVSNDNLELTNTQIGFDLINNQIVRNPYNVSYNNNIEYPKTKTFNLAFVGRYDFYAKGQDVILRVLSDKKWKDRELVINFYGEGKDEEQLKELIVLYDLKNVNVNSQTSTELIWKNNHGLILTSRFEGLPIVIVEAMLCKRFVIVTDVSGSAELVKDNFSGFIAEAPRVKFVDATLERAWERRCDWEKMGIQARNEIVKFIPEKPELLFAEELIKIAQN